MAYTTHLLQNAPMKHVHRAEPLKIALIGFHGVTTLDIAGPMDVFHCANTLLAGKGPAYELILASPNGGQINASGGLSFANSIALTELPDDLDTIMVAGGNEEGLRACADTSLPTWLAARATTTRRIASVCTGAFVLAHAGLLSGRRATTHWFSCDILQQMWPDIEIQPDAIFVADPPFYTSAGVTSGIDLSLSFVEQDLGSRLATQIARHLVVFMRRPGGQSQFSTALKAQSSASPTLENLLAEISENPCGDLRVDALAERAGMSPRTFQRRFQHDIGCAPAEFVMRVRTERAKTLLETTDWPLARVADKSGFGTVFSLHRAFHNLVGATPGDYRARFAAHDQT